MDTTAIALGLLNICVAAVCILINIPLLKRKIPMNRWYGARFKKSFESEENWYRINAHSAKQAILWSIPLLLIGVITLFLPLAEHRGLSNVLVFGPLLLCVPCLLSYRYARKL